MTCRILCQGERTCPSVNQAAVEKRGHGRGPSGRHTGRRSLLQHSQCSEKIKKTGVCSGWSGRKNAVSPGGVRRWGNGRGLASNNSFFMLCSWRYTIARSVERGSHDNVIDDRAITSSRIVWSRDSCLALPECAFRTYVMAPAPPHARHGTRLTGSRDI